MNGIIDKCDYPSTLDAKTKSDETLRVSIPFKDQVSANTVKRHMRDLSSKIGIDVQPIYTSKKLDNDVLETSKRRAVFYNILSQIFIAKCFTKSWLIRIRRRIQFRQIKFSFYRI